MHGQVTKRISEDRLERYAMRRLLNSAQSKVEKHLLICSDCRERLEAEDRFLAAIRAAATTISSMKPKKMQAAHA